MPRERQKKKKRGGVPARWLDYCAVGSRIPGTRFISFKVPLSVPLNRRVPSEESFCLWDLLHRVEEKSEELGIIIDLTFTTRYYSPSEVPQSCLYVKIPTEGRHVPSDAAILSFKRAVRTFLRENQDNEQLIGVHCTHGLNRTGYLVCRYLIDVDGLDSAMAVNLFNSSRGHDMERENYIQDLLTGAKRSNEGMEETGGEMVRGGAVERPTLDDLTTAHTQTPEQTHTHTQAHTQTHKQGPTQTHTEAHTHTIVDPQLQQETERPAVSNRRRRQSKHRRKAQKASGLLPTPTTPSLALLPTPSLALLPTPSLALLPTPRHNPAPLLPTPRHNPAPLLPTPPTCSPSSLPMYSWGDKK